MNAGDPDANFKKTTAETWQDRVEDAVGRAEEELRTVVAYINDEVVPDVRRSGSEALRTAASELGKLAERLDGRLERHRADRRTGSGPKA